MCGCFAYVAGPGGSISIPRLKKIARVTETRGRHAFGLAWLDGRGRLHCYKQAGRITRFKAWDRLEDAKLLIGHCRYATQGDPRENINNHPHPADGGWIVHNGKIRNYFKLLWDFDLHPTSQCDSEVIGLLIEQGIGSRREGFEAAVEATQSKPLVCLGLWAHPTPTIIAARRGNPLSIGFAKGGAYLASLPEGLPGDVREVEDGATLEFHLPRNPKPTVAST
jgi:glucosamine 6-phosphate synthetase-like amidotransferase/phosphosugar isomerase protein